jgi:uncharacterized membrane protein
MTTNAPDAGAPQAGPRAPGAPTGKWRALLMLSLAINLLVAGFAASAVWRHRHHHGMGGAAGRGTEEIGLRGFLKSLPAERAKQLKALTEAGKPDFKPLFEATREARRQAADVIAAEPFSQDQLTEAFGKIDAAEANVKMAARTAIITAASNMTIDERKRLAAHWKSRRSKLFGGHGPGHHSKKPKTDSSEVPAAP